MVLGDFQVQLEQRVALDAGSSTGGFTQVLLERGVSRVYAVDVGRNQLHRQLRDDDRVVVMEGTDVRREELAGLRPRPDLLVADLSYISLRQVIPHLSTALAPECDCLVLVKPQFESGPGAVDRRGVVRSAAVRADAVAAVAAEAQRWGLRPCGVSRSAVPGAAGNLEYFLWLKRGGEVAACPIAELYDWVGKDGGTSSSTTSTSTSRRRCGESEAR